MLFVILIAGLGAIVLQARSLLPTLLELRNYFPFRRCLVN